MTAARTGQDAAGSPILNRLPLAPIPPMRGALCADPEIPSELWDWQGPDESRALAEERYELAREVCAMCPIAARCLQIAEGDPMPRAFGAGSCFGLRIAGKRTPGHPRNVSAPALQGGGQSQPDRQS